MRGGRRDALEEEVASQAEARAAAAEAAEEAQRWGMKQSRAAALAVRTAAAEVVRGRRALDEAAAAKAAALTDTEARWRRQLSMAEAEAERLRAEAAELRAHLSAHNGTPLLCVYTCIPWPSIFDPGAEPPFGSTNEPDMEEKNAALEKAPGQEEAPVSVVVAKEAEALLEAVWSMEAEWRAWAMRTLHSADGADVNDAAVTPAPTGPRRRMQVLSADPAMCTPAPVGSAVPGAVWDSPSEEQGGGEGAGGYELARAAFAWDSPGEAAALQHSRGGSEGDKRACNRMKDAHTRMQRNKALQGQLLALLSKRFSLPSAAPLLSLDDDGVQAAVHGQGQGQVQEKRGGRTWRTTIALGAMAVPAYCLLESLATECLPIPT